jgi:hypothetical protein
MSVIYSFEHDIRGSELDRAESRVAWRISFTLFRPSLGVCFEFEFGMFEISLQSTVQLP